MKKIAVGIIFVLILITTYPTLAAIQNIEEKTISKNETTTEVKKHLSCYIEVEGVWDNNYKVMYWLFPYLKSDGTCFVFWWNISFPFNDAVISIYRNQGGKLLYERNDLGAIKILFFVGLYDSTYYYLTIKGKALMVESE